MRQRGRKSPETLAALAATELAEPKPTLEPPKYMAARERAEWRSIVARFGSSAFPPETRVLLAALCGVMVALDAVSAELSKLGPGIPSDRSSWCKFRDLIALRGQLATQVASVGTKLRIFPQSRDVRRLKTADYERLREADDIKPWTDNVN
jgi:hypothetical protein